LEFARNEIDRVFGSGYAAAHPDVVASVTTSAAMGDTELSALREQLVIRTSRLRRKR